MSSAGGGHTPAAPPESQSAAAGQQRTVIFIAGPLTCHPARRACTIGVTRPLRCCAHPMSTLAEVLARATEPGVLSERLADGRLRCLACGHRCPLPDGA